MLHFDADRLIRNNQELFVDDNTGVARKYFVEFMEIACEHIKREGVTELLAYLCTTDFFNAPASTKYHGCFAGGLCQHSVTVFHELTIICSLYNLDASDETIALISLFHDMCKIGMYKKAQRWKKEDGMWVSYDTYMVEEDLPFGGHGSKSVYMLSNFLKLSEEEACAINTHMGTWDGNTLVSKTYEKYPLAWALHVADEASTFIRRI